MPPKRRLKRLADREAGEELPTKRLKKLNTYLLSAFNVQRTPKLPIKKALKRRKAKSLLIKPTPSLLRVKGAQKELILVSSTPIVLSLTTP
jgi:hypothetical protein